MSARKPKPERTVTPNNTPGVIDGGCLYTMTELAARARWRKHSIRQAVRKGLPTILFGSRRYILGSDALKFFARLRDEQQANHDGGATS